LERDQLKGESDGLAAERDGLVARIDEFERQQASLMGELAHLVAERNALALQMV
jgi:hypothetical protein